MRTKIRTKIRKAYGSGTATFIRRTLPLTVLALTALFGGSGFTLRPDIDRANHKNIPSYNNAGLNSAHVTPTEIVTVPKLSTELTRDVPGIHYAVVLRRHNTLFVGIDTGDMRHSSSVVVHARDWLKQQSPTNTIIYVSSDPTLVNHFHRYAADRAAHLQVSSDIIIADIGRNFPGAK